MKTKNCKICLVAIGSCSRSLLCYTCYNKKYYEIHKQEIKKKWYKYNCEYYLKDKSKEQKRNRYHKDIEKSRMYARLWRHNNKLKFREQKKSNYRKNTEKSRESFRENNRIHYLTRGLIQEVYERNIRENGVLTCYLCGKPIAFGADNLEHKIPICRGGTHTLDNMDITHALCNLSKGRKTYQECIEQHIIFPPKALKEVA